MKQDKAVRRPQQERSIKTKEKILDAAYRLFCEKGYYNTTTNEIAQVANVSIGSLYSYFKDKDTILLEILDRYNDSFFKVHDKLSRDMELYKSDLRMWFRRLIEGLIEVHQISKELNCEMNILCYSMPEVAAVQEKQREKTWQMTLQCFQAYKEYIKVEDIEAAAIVTFKLISAVVDQIVFGKNDIDNERILQAGVEAVYKFLIG
ncbi:transcriptional regulator, TetR family [Anaerocolumna jejuensis DSM 15929]|uniref:Transcriptional regulator, TetR family n=1 Tax=Anaerocolumna jejuensis DSM 15929 TaxID=1121322 RepID=A0A1M6PXQ1_9FIRM|nr:TetR/AcrR family transcriptional regulator [Anaerocolumna jejuensis]SHK12682.1 transcriptional regulator, TetR family [Anaerocolumna jejuensis DSM 15929]